MDKIKVMLYGVGVISSLIARNLLEKEGVEISCAVDIAADKVNKDLGEVLQINRKLGVRISKDLDGALSTAEADIAVHATSSMLRSTFPQISSIVRRRVNVISTCEELVYPYRTEPGIAEELNMLAQKNDVSILGSGINPGFLMDTLVIALTAPCQKIEKISVKRVMNAATRRLPFQKKIGTGSSVSEFESKIRRKKISGHVGLEQSIAMVADALQWKLDSIQVEEPEPITLKKSVESREMKIEAGRIAGLKQVASGIIKGRQLITLDFQAYVGAAEEYDEVTIEGVPPIKQRIQPCVHGDIGTVAMIVNNIPRVIKASPGLLTMRNLPIPSAVLGDMRLYV